MSAERFAELEQKIKELEPAVSKERLAAAVDLQVNRFRSDYQNYLEREDSKKAVTFFFEKVYSMEFRDAKRDKLARDVWVKVRDRFKPTTRANFDKLMLLNDFSYWLDLKMAASLPEKDSEAYVMADYEEAFADCANRLERIEQLNLLIYVFETYFKYSRRPTFKVVIVPLRFMAKFFKAKSLISMIDEGYEASTSIKPEVFEQFLAAIRANEEKLINRLLPG